MPMDTRHTIEEFVLDLNFEAELPAYEIERDLVDWLRNDLLPPFEALFDRVSGAGEILRLDVLEIDLGTISFDNFKDEIRNRLLSRLAAALEEKAGGLKRTPHLDDAIAAGAGVDRSILHSAAGADDSIQYSRGDLLQLLLFLENGSLSWQASADRATAHEKLLARVLQADSRTFFDEVSRSPHKGILIARLARQFPHSQLLGLLQKTRSIGATLFSELVALLESGAWPVGPSEVRHAFWESLILAAVSASGESQEAIIAQAVWHYRETEKGGALEFLAAISEGAAREGNEELKRALDGSALPVSQPAVASDAVTDTSAETADDKMALAYDRLKYSRLHSGTVAIEQLGLDAAGMSALLRKFIEQDQSAGIGNRRAFLQAIESHARQSQNKEIFYTLVLRALLARELLDLEAMVRASANEIGAHAMQDSSLRAEIQAEHKQVAANPAEDTSTRPAPGADNQLRFKLAHCLLHGDAVQLESMWHLLYRSHPALTIDALRHYGRFERVRRQFATNFHESILRDFSELLAPEARLILTFLMERAGSLSSAEHGAAAWKRGMWDVAFDVLLGDKATDYSPLRLAECLLHFAANDAVHTTGTSPEERLQETAEHWIAVLGTGAPPVVAGVLRKSLHVESTSGIAPGEDAGAGSGANSGAELLNKVKRALISPEMQEAGEAGKVVRSEAGDSPLASALNLLALRYPERIQQLFDELRRSDWQFRFGSMNARSLRILTAAWVKFEAAMIPSELVSGMRDRQALLSEIERQVASDDQKHAATYYESVLRKLLDSKSFTPSELFRIARSGLEESNDVERSLSAADIQSGEQAQMWARMQRREVKSSELSLPVGELAKLVVFSLNAQRTSRHAPAASAQAIATAYAALFDRRVEYKHSLAADLSAPLVASELKSGDKRAPPNDVDSNAGKSGQASFGTSMPIGELEEVLEAVFNVAGTQSQRHTLNSQERNLRALESVAAKTNSPEVFYHAILEVLLSEEGRNSQHTNALGPLTQHAEASKPPAESAVAKSSNGTTPSGDSNFGSTTAIEYTRKPLEPVKQAASAKIPSTDMQSLASEWQAGAKADELTTTLRQLQLQQASPVAEFARPLMAHTVEKTVAPHDALSEATLKDWIDHFLHAVAGADEDSRAVFMESLTSHTESAKSRTHFLRIVLARLLRRETIDLEQILQELQETDAPMEEESKVVLPTVSPGTSKRFGIYGEFQQALRSAQLQQDQADKLNLALGGFQIRIAQSPQELSEAELIHLIDRYLEVLAGADAGNRQLFLNAIRDHTESAQHKGAFLIGVLVRLLRKQSIDLEELQRESNQSDLQELLEDAPQWHPFADEAEGIGGGASITQLRREISIAIAEQVQADDERHAAFLHAIEHHVQLSTKPRRFYQLVLAALQQRQVVDLEALVTESAKEELAANGSSEESAALTSSVLPVTKKQAEVWFAALRAAVHSNATSEIRQQFAMALTPKAEAAREQLRQAMGDASFTAALLVALTETARIDALAALLPEDFAEIKRTVDIAGDALLFLSESITKERVSSIKWRAVFHYFFVQKALYVRAGFNKFLASRMAQEARMPSDVVLRQLIELALHADAPAPAGGKGVAAGAGTGSNDRMGARPQARQHTAAAPTATQSNVDVHVENAGLILAWPYLPRLFDLLNLMQKNVFVDRQAAERAVHLLQFMVTGQSRTPEYALVLNKQLCGISTGLPIVGGIDITDHERQTIENLIRGMIANWKVIGNTSVDGFRQSFLQRQGWMSLQEEVWQLRVETRAYDMLLDQLPWGISMVKHVWMTHPIQVKWR